MAKMDDWGEYVESSGAFVKEFPFAKLINEGAVVLVTSVVKQLEGQYGPQWQVHFLDPAGDELIKGFKTGIPDRDSRMLRLQETLEATGEPIEARFIKVGKRNDITGA